MGKFVDSIIAFRILHMLVTPFDQTPAYKLGIIDENGKELKKMRELNTVEERDAYTLLHRLVYRMKRIMNKVPIENKKFLSLAAAYALIREDLDAGKESINLEEKFMKRIDLDLTEELKIVNEAFSANKIFTFKQFTEEMTPASGVSANNAMATAGVQGLGTEVPISKKAQKKWTTKNQMFTRGKPNV
jgi:hypothetical protein